MYVNLENPLSLKNRILKEIAMVTEAIADCNSIEDYLKSVCGEEYASGNFDNIRKSLKQYRSLLEINNFPLEKDQS